LNLKLKMTLCAGLASAMLAPSAAQAWTRSYLVEWFEPALLYGGPENGGGATEGADCPGGINPALDWRKELIAYGLRTPERAAQIDNAEFGRQNFLRELGFRGPHGMTVHQNPTGIPDPGIIEVSWDKAEGFNLDENEATGGFTNALGEKGVDNEFYRVSGCILRFRGRPRDAPGFKDKMAFMHDGSFTVVIVMSGEKDPMNDDNVTVGIYGSKDDSVKDGVDKVAFDYSFRIDGDPTYESVFKAKITNGVVESTERFTLRTHDVTDSRETPTLVLEKAKVRWEMQPDGTMKGLIGGYRDWFEYYREMAQNGDAISSSIREANGHWSLPAWYYAMRSKADGMKDPQTGQYRGISTAYRYTMVPAYVVNPEGKEPVYVARKFASN